MLPVMERKKCFIHVIRYEMCKNVLKRYPHHLQESQISRTHVVKVDLYILPSDFREVGINECQTLCFVVDLIRKEVLFCCLIKTVVILSSKKVHTHDAEDEPENQTNQQHIHDGGNGTHQGVDHNLKRGSRKHMHCDKAFTTSFVLHQQKTQKCKFNLSTSSTVALCFTRFWSLIRWFSVFCS